MREGDLSRCSFCGKTEHEVRKLIKAYYSQEVYICELCIDVCNEIIGEELAVEAHVLDFDGDLYHRRVALQFIERLREERRFASPGELVAQIHALGGRAEGLVAHDRVVVADAHPRTEELGYVGVVRTIRTAPIRAVFGRHAIPVISPVGTAGRQR